MLVMPSISLEILRRELLTSKWQVGQLRVQPDWPWNLNLV